MGAKRAAKKAASKRRKAPPASKAFQHNDSRTWTWPLLVLLSVLAVYAANPTPANPAHPFLLLSYQLPATDARAALAGPLRAPPAQYAKGPRDMAFVAFYTVLLTFTREFCMRELLRPLARAVGIAARAKQQRFAEQMYTALYIAVAAPWGVLVLRATPVWFCETAGMYAGFPHTLHAAGFKAYYLVQAAFWLQQVVVMVLGLEERRKDFKELVAHHVVTVALIAGSYCFHFTYIGIVVYITHDVSDFFLAVSKSLNYAGSRAQGPTFALCIAMWVYLRHYLNLRILGSMLPGAEFSTVGPYELDWAAQQYKGPLANCIAFALLATLQSLNIFWLYCLLRSAYRLAFLGIAKDDRSDGEEVKEEEQEIDEALANMEQDDREHVKDMLVGKVGETFSHVNGNGHSPKLVQRQSRRV